jgi:parallel beta-helix repeat protein
MANNNNRFGFHVHSSNTILINNTANYNRFQGFKLEAFRDGCINNQLINNTANYNGQSGYMITEGCQNTQVVNNTEDGTLWKYPQANQSERTNTTQSLTSRNLFKPVYITYLTIIGVIILILIHIIRYKRG